MSIFSLKKSFENLKNANEVDESRLGEVSTTFYY